MKKLFACVCCVGCLVLPGHSAEMRIWTSRKGGTLEASLRAVQGDTVALINKDSKEIKLKTEDLSLADRQHLVEFGGADESIIAGGKPGLVEKEVKIDTSTFKRLEDTLSFMDSAGGFELLETPHFLVGTSGKVKPQAIAETAERLWYGMAFVHMNFRQDWGDKRMLILLVEDRDIYAELGKWYTKHLKTEGHEEAALEVANTWEKTGSTSILVPDGIVTKHNIFDRAAVFNVKEADKFKKVLAPFPTHSLAGRLLGKQTGNVSSFGAEGYFALLTGHAYFKEISLAGKSETQLLAVDGTDRDDISSKAGFEDGTSWARTLRSMVRSGKVPVKLQPMLQWQSSELTPEKLVLIYSFAAYMQSDTKRLGAFAKMIRRIEVSKQIPSPEEFAKIFGFETVEAFEADWAKFIKEGDFR